MAYCFTMSGLAPNSLYKSKQYPSKDSFSGTKSSTTGQATLTLKYRTRENTNKEISKYEQSHQVSLKPIMLWQTVFSRSCPNRNGLHIQSNLAKKKVKSETGSLKNDLNVQKSNTFSLPISYHRHMNLGNICLWHIWKRCCPFICKSLEKNLISRLLINKSKHATCSAQYGKWKVVLFKQ